MEEDNQNEVNPEINGDFRGGTEYPTSHPKEAAILERRALKEGWLTVIDDHAEQMVKRQIVDSLDPKLSPRDRRGSFSAVMKAKADAEGKSSQAVNIQINHKEMTQEEQDAWVKATLENAKESELECDSKNVSD